LDAVLSLAGLLIFRAPRNCLGEARHGCDLGFGSGIARGYATLGQAGFSEHSGYTAIGTVCNLAARLCAEAKDGQILVSSRIAEAVEAVARLEDLGNLELKIETGCERGLSSGTGAPTGAIRAGNSTSTTWTALQSWSALDRWARSAVSGVGTSRKLLALWGAYNRGTVSRSELGKRSQNTTDVLSILHWREDTQNGARQTTPLPSPSTPTPTPPTQTESAGEEPT